MIKPPALQKGDTIRIISTARKITAEELEPSVRLLEEWGFKVQFSAHLLNEHHQFAGTTTERAADLQEAINSTEVQCILCARGGYGTVKIIDLIDFKPLMESPKWIVGFSDVTTLHSHLNNLGMETIHGTMPILFEQEGGELARNSLHKALSNSCPNINFSHHPLNRLGQTKGLLVGGNLSILNNLIGTESHLDCTGKILFLEDLDEYLYHIDRMMTQLKRSGMLEGLAGLVIGGMTDMNDNNIPYGQTAHEIIAETVKGFNYPVAFNLPAGHIPDNRALNLGAEVSLTVSEKSSRIDFS